MKKKINNTNLGANRSHIYINVLRDNQYITYNLWAIINLVATKITNNAIK